MTFARRRTATGGRVMRPEDEWAVSAFVNAMMWATPTELTRSDDGTATARLSVKFRDVPYDVTLTWTPAQVEAEPRAGAVVA
jgi:hypothetical protein